MHRNLTGLITRTITALIMPTALFASPMVEIDTIDANVGTIIEGKVTSAKHIFKLKNTGDSALVIQNVRPGWGCTSVGHDSIILPGREGTVTAEVPIANLHSSGEFRKSLTVTTNAKNNPSFKLSMGGVYRQIVEFEPSTNVRLTVPKENDTGALLLIKTGIKDLKILDVSFKENGKELDWKSYVPIKFSLTQDALAQKKDTAKVKKPSGKGKQPEVLPEPLTYKLRISYIPLSKTDQYGEFVLKTNIKEKPEIKLSGILEGKKE